jgi:hypothetical protein
MDIAYIFIISILFFNIIAKIRKKVEWEVTCEETTGAVYGAGVVMMMIPGLQVFGFGISAMALAAGYNC